VTFNHGVAGSNPAGLTNKINSFSKERFPENPAGKRLGSRAPNEVSMLSTKPSARWHTGHAAPNHHRLLLIVSAAGEPPDAQLMDDCEVVVGYRDGERGFFPVTAPGAKESSAALKVKKWRELPSLPRGVKLREQID
jgi:hypothetical protein